MKDIPTHSQSKMNFSTNRFSCTYVELFSLFGVVELFNNTLFCKIKIPASPHLSVSTN